MSKYDFIEKVENRMDVFPYHLPNKVEWEVRALLRKNGLEYGRVFSLPKDDLGLKVAKEVNKILDKHNIDEQKRMVDLVGVETVNESLNDASRKELEKEFNKFHSAYVDWMRAVNKIFGRSSKEAMQLDKGQMDVMAPGRDNLKKTRGGYK